MKKAAIIIVLALMVPLCLFAESYRFSIVWEKLIAPNTSLTVVNLDDTDEVANHEKELDITSAVQDVARIQYISTEGGIHVLSYKATPLMNNDDSKGYSFNLFFKFTENGETNTQEIQVGTNKSLSYPIGASVYASTSINQGRGGDQTPKYILIQAELLEATINSMQTDVTYSSTITIERTSP